MDCLHWDLSHGDRYCLCLWQGEVVGRSVKSKLYIAARSSVLSVVVCLPAAQPAPAARLGAY